MQVKSCAHAPFHDQLQYKAGSTPGSLPAYTEDGWYNDHRSGTAALPEGYRFAWGLSQARHGKPAEDPVHFGAFWFRIFPAVPGRSLLLYISERSCRAGTFALLFFANPGSR